MPITHKKVNRTKKVVRKGKKMSGGNRKVNRTRKVGGNRSRKVGRSRKMVGGAKSKSSKKTKANASRSRGMFRGALSRIKTRFTAVKNAYHAHIDKKAAAREQVQNLKRKVLSESVIARNSNAQKRVNQLFGKRNFRKAVDKTVKYATNPNKLGQYFTAREKVEQSLNAIRAKAKTEQAKKNLISGNRMKIRKALAFFKLQEQNAKDLITSDSNISKFIRKKGLIDADELTKMFERKGISIETVRTSVIRGAILEARKNDSNPNSVNIFKEPAFN